MIAGAASCPHPPLLLPGMTGQPVPAVEQLRAACLAAVRDLLALDLDRVVVVGGVSAPQSDRWGDGDPLSIAVGQLLLAEVGCEVPIEQLRVAQDASAAECLTAGRGLPDGASSRLGLLVLADGSARRGPKAPGYLDPRADPFDSAVQAALEAADARALAALDPELAAELMVAGRAAWQVLAGAMGDQAFRAQRYYGDDPFGVWYPVVGWTAADR